ncbi:hypothetical protein GCM10009801_81960 [Streptomyces albiaxialis]|uniref:Uncharacterized protein n=1 Tax=Streptomyces albiaxialis TaxID=329523 RepID=A0ABN2X6S2_9ACTN
MDPDQLARIRRQLLDQPGPIEDEPEALDAELARLDVEAGTARSDVETAATFRRRAWVLARLARHRGGRWNQLADEAVNAWHQQEGAAVSEAVRDQLAAEAELWLSRHAHG